MNEATGGESFFSNAPAIPSDISVDAISGSESNMALINEIKGLKSALSTIHFVSFITENNIDDMDELKAKMNARRNRSIGSSL